MLPAPARADSLSARVIELQQLAGNAAVAGLLQRQATTRLRRPPAPRKRGSTGHGVKKLQQRLNARGQEPPLRVDGISAR